MRRRLECSAHGEADTPRWEVADGWWATTWRERSRFPDASADAGAHGPSTPVPGTVTVVLVAVGEVVEAGQTLVVLEAMKMEHRINADVDGVVAELHVEVGQSVDAHHVGAPVLDMSDAGGRCGSPTAAASSATGSPRPREMVEGGPIDVLTGDWLAELTMLILARQRMKHGAGSRVRPHLPHADGAGARHLPRARHQGRLQRRRPRPGRAAPTPCGRPPSGSGCRRGSPYVEGDDLMPRLDELAAAGEALVNLDTGERFADFGMPALTANAYLGGFGIAAALAAGADVVITGRVTDAALVVGPAAWWHGWATRRLRRARRRGRGRPRHRVRRPGHRRQLRVLRRGARPRAPRLPDRRDRRRRLLASSPSTPGTGGLVSRRHGHRAAALRDRRPGVRQPGRHRAVRHHRARPRTGPTACASRGVRGERAARPAQGRAQRPRRLPQPDDARAHRPRHRGQGRPGRAHAVGRTSTRSAFETRRRAAGRAHDREDPRSTADAQAHLRITVTAKDPKKVGRAFSNALVEMGAGVLPGLLPDRAAGRGDAVRRLLADHGAGRAHRAGRHRGRRRGRPGARRVAARAAVGARRAGDAAAGGRAAPATWCASRWAGSSAPAPATRAATPTSACGGAATRRTPGWPSTSTPPGSPRSCPRRAGCRVDRFCLPNLRAVNFVVARPARPRGRRQRAARPAGQGPRRAAAGAPRRPAGGAAARRGTGAAASGARPVSPAPPLTARGQRTREGVLAARPRGLRAPRLQRDPDERHRRRGRRLARHGLHVLRVEGGRAARARRRDRRGGGRGGARAR